MILTKITLCIDNPLTESDFYGPHSPDDMVAIIRDTATAELKAIQNRNKISGGVKEYLTAEFLARVIRHKTGYKIYASHERRLLSDLGANPDLKLPFHGWAQYYTTNKMGVCFRTSEGPKEYRIPMDSEPITHDQFLTLVPGPIYP
jgi:hypothetical protein